MAEENNNNQDNDSAKQGEQLSNIPEEKEILKWSFPEAVDYDRSRNWYVIAIGILALMIVYSLFIANFLFAIFLILFSVVMMLQVRRTSQSVEFKVLDKGILIGEKFYNWSDIKSFRIINEPKPKRVYFDLRNSVLPDISIPLKVHDSIEVARILKQYLDEDKETKGENIIDILSRWLKI